MASRSPKSSPAAHDAHQCLGCADGHAHHEHAAHDHDHSHDHDHDHAPIARQKLGIYLVSPSGAADPDLLPAAKTNLAALGFKVTADRTAMARHQRFGGTDAQRLAALHRAADQKHDIVMATRGGYGMSRLMDQIDWARLADSGKRFVGFSDITALHLGLLAKTGTVSYAGPCALSDFGKKVDDLTADLFAEVMHGELEILSFETRDADPVDCRGILWGGNLALVTAMLGTPYMPKTRGILFLEDVAEHPFRVERMLIQLLQAGVLKRQKAIVLGSFTDYRLTAHDNGFDLNEVIAWIRRETGVPVVTGLPFGHTATKATLPVGAKVGLATEEGMAHLVIDEHTH